MEMTEKLMHIQTELKAPKNLYNKFGNFNYRNAEGILEAVKPLLKKYKCALTIEDFINNANDRYYVKATATLWDSETGKGISTTAYAREPESKKGMDESQITGTASSYARKYALNGLFILDDTKDPDTDEYHAQLNQPLEKKYIKALDNACKKAGKKPSELEALAGVTSFSEITMQQYQAAMQEVGAE